MRVSAPSSGTSTPRKLATGTGTSTSGAAQSASAPIRPIVTATSQQSRFHAATLDADTTEIDLETVCVAVGGAEVLVDASLKLREGVRYGLIGRNGSGKSSLLQALADKIIPGLPPSLRVHIVTQIDENDQASSSDSKSMTVLEHVLDGHTERKRALQQKAALTKALESDKPEESQRILDELLLQKAKEKLEDKRKIASRRSGARGKEARAEEIKAEQELDIAIAKLEVTKSQTGTAATVAEMLAEVDVSLELLGAEDCEKQADEILRGLGFKKAMIAGPYEDLSGGWRSRCRLATALLVQTDLLLLDEPSNFMDLKAVLWLETALPLISSYTTLVLTSHDQIFLDHLAEQTIYLRGSKLDYFPGSPSLMLRTEAEERHSKSKMIAALDKKKEHVQSSIASGRKAAKDKGDDNKARMVKSRQKKLDNRWGLEQSAKGTRFKLNRDLGGYHTSARAEVVLQEEERAVKMRLNDPAEIRAVGALAHLEGVAAGYKGKKAVLEGVNLSVHAKSRIALVGANGEGKSTLAKILTTHLKPVRGTITTHPTSKIGYFDQQLVESLSAFSHQTALERMIEHFSREGQVISEMEGRRYLGSMGLHGRTAADVPIGALSGGQKVRLGLGLVMYRAPHVLVLDEVTTHLDAQTIHALAKALRRWEGAIVLISHDRWFTSAVIDGKFDEEDDVSDSVESDEDESPGETYLVEKGVMRKLQLGMEEYEEAVRDSVRKKLAKSSIR